MPDVAEVQSLVRGLSVIRAFNQQNPRQTLAQVAEATGLARATARRFLHTLISQGYAGTDGSEFWLTPKVLELGYAYLSSLGLPTIAQPHIERLSREVDESCSLSVLDGGDVVYVARAAVRKIMSTSITIGTRFPAYATSMGRVLLSGLDADALETYWRGMTPHAITPRTITKKAELFKAIAQVKERGWCIVDQELELGLRSIAGPVHDHDGRLVASVNISTPYAMHDEEELHTRFLPALLTTCQAISTDLRNTHLSSTAIS